MGQVENTTTTGTSECSADSYRGRSEGAGHVPERAVKRPIWGQPTCRESKRLSEVWVARAGVFDYPRYGVGNVAGKGGKGDGAGRFVTMFQGHKQMGWQRGLLLCQGRQSGRRDLLQGECVESPLKEPEQVHHMDDERSRAFVVGSGFCPCVTGSTSLSFFGAQAHPVTAPATTADDRRDTSAAQHSKS